MGDDNVYNKNINIGDLLLIYFEDDFINGNQLLGEIDSIDLDTSQA